MNTFLILLCALFFMLWMWPANPRDDTDPPDGVSGMKLYIDAHTGCHYLGNPNGGITPRLDADGKHICAGRRS